METGQRRQGMVERGSKDPRGGIHVLKFELPQHRQMICHLWCLLPFGGENASAGPLA
jgi:hypothetical protein